MKILLLLLSSIFVAVISFSQTPFSGAMTYRASISYADTNLVIKEWQVRVFTNDTIVRVETETGQFGTQVYIRHMQLGKAYLLLELDGQKFAIQTTLTKKADTIPANYTVKKMHGRKTIAGVKCRKYWVKDKDADGFVCYFAKKIGNKYLEVYPEVPGLAVDYFLPSQEGLIHYELISMKNEPVNRDLFGIPSDFKRITFEEFLRIYYSDNEQ